MLLPTAGQPLIDKEPPMTCSEKDILDVLAAVLNRKHLDQSVRCGRMLAGVFSWLAKQTICGHRGA
jgi:hypothetical protein